VDRPDYSVFDFTQGEETVQFLIGVVDTVTITCGTNSSINFLVFLWDNTLIFALLKYGIICVPLASPTVLYLRHHWATRGLDAEFPMHNVFLELSACTRPFRIHMHGSEFVQVSCVSPSTPVSAECGFIHGVTHL